MYGKKTIASGKDKKISMPDVMDYYSYGSFIDAILKYVIPLFVCQIKCVSSI